MHKATQCVRALGLLLFLVGSALPVGARAEQAHLSTKPAVDHAPGAAKHVRHAKPQTCDRAEHAQTTQARAR